jgi:branched-chain amino acid transport system substrate-binding protein
MRVSKGIELSLRVLVLASMAACGEEGGDGDVAAEDSPSPIAYVGPLQPSATTAWKTIPNPGQSVLAPHLTQAYHQYCQDPYGLPTAKPYGNFVDPIQAEKPEPLGPAARIGFIGCLSGPAASYSGNMLAGAQLAMEELNRAGGYFGRPFELVTRDDKAVMGLDGHAMVELIFDENVVGILGSMSSDTTHVGIRVALKAEVPQMTSISTDPTISQVIVPWAFRILADDWSQGRAMAKLVFQDLGLTKVAIIERNNRYGRMGSLEIARVAQRMGHPVAIKLKVDLVEDYSPQLRIVKDYHPEALVIWGMYTEASRITKQARAMGIDAVIFGADGLVSQKYIELTGKDAEQVIVTFPYNFYRDTEVNRAFIKNYTAKYGSEPDSFSAHGYDAMLAMGTAILEAGERHGKDKGLNRAFVRDELARLEGLEGATGRIGFDHTGNDMRVVEFAVIEDGKFQSLDGNRKAKLREQLHAGR